MSWLARILRAKRDAVTELAARRLPNAPSRREVRLRRARGEPLRLIAEIKRRSPSAGRLSTKLGVAERAQAYERAGASMVSVLVDAGFFDGAYEHLAEARRGTLLPILCKEFVLDEIQLRAARAYGADAVLIIVRTAPPGSLRSLIDSARALDLEPLVEVATASEAEAALEAGADLVGVNARDLDTLEVDLERARRVLEALPKHVVRVHLSGIGSPDAVDAVARSGVDAALVGEVLMREDDPEPLLRSLRSACGGAQGAGAR